MSQAVACPEGVAVTQAVDGSAVARETREGRGTSGSRYLHGQSVYPRSYRFS